MKQLDYKDYFSKLFPGFFEREYIRNLPEKNVAEELVIDLHNFSAEDVKLTCPEHITFGMYNGDLDALHAAVNEVEDSWAEFFTKESRIYCAFDGDKVVSFCLVDDFGVYNGLKVGGPGCVGTIPSYRRQGIGLKMVEKATQILKERGFDYSYIHYTGVGPWYAKLGYELILQWDKRGLK